MVACCWHGMACRGPDLDVSFCQVYVRILASTFRMPCGICHACVCAGLTTGHAALQRRAASESSGSGGSGGSCSEEEEADDPRPPVPVPGPAGSLWASGQAGPASDPGILRLCQVRQAQACHACHWLACRLSCSVVVVQALHGACACAARRCWLARPTFSACSARWWWPTGRTSRDVSHACAEHGPALLSAPLPR